MIALVTASEAAKAHFGNPFGELLGLVGVPCGPGGEVSWNGTPWRVTVPQLPGEVLGACFRVGLFGIAALIGRQTSSKAKYVWETDSEQVL